MWPAGSTTLHGETSYQEMLDHFRDYTDVVGDNPMNLGATTLAFTAYALTGETKYRDWVLEYVDAWVERTEANDGLLPTSVGLDGNDRQRLRLVRRRLRLGILGPADPACAARWRTGNTTFERAVYGFGSALLLTGERRYVDLWRRMLDLVNANSKEEDGEVVYPHMYGRLDRLDRLQQGGTIDDLPPEGPEGWYEFRSRQVRAGRRSSCTTGRSTARRSTSCPRRRAWVRYLDGRG